MNSMIAHELLKRTRGPSQTIGLGVSLCLCLAIFFVVADFDRSLAESITDENLFPVSSAGSRLESLLAKASSVTNVTASLEDAISASRGGPVASYPYYRSIQAGITRIEQLGTSYSANGDASPFLDYAFLIDEIARLVYVQSHGQFAVLDAKSGEIWLSITDLLAGKPSRLGGNDIELTGVYDIGSDVVDNSHAEVFMLQTKPTRDQRLWVESQHGLVIKAQWQSSTYQLIGVKTDTKLSKDLFALDIKGKVVPEITQMQLGDWSSTAHLPDPEQAFALMRCSSSPTVLTAADEGDTNAVQTFLATSNELVNAANSCGSTPLHYAAMEGRLDVVKLLIANKATVDSRNKADATPLWLAAANGRVDVVRFLISKSANVNVRTKVTGLTPLHIAALNGQKEVVDLLMANGADVKAVTASGETALRLALRRGHKEVADLLRQQKATK